MLAEYMDYIFTTGLKLEKAAILYGSGANGKSVFFEVVNALIGPDNICSYSLQNLTKYDSYQRAELSINCSITPRRSTENWRRRYSSNS